MGADARSGQLSDLASNHGTTGDTENIPCFTALNVTADITGSTGGTGNASSGVCPPETDS